MKPLFLINLLCRSLLFAAICFCNTVKADWLSVCQSDNRPLDSFFQKTYYKSNGSVYWLSLSRQKPDACEVVELALNNQPPLWMGLISADLASRLGERPLLHSLLENDRIKISEIIPQFPEKVETKNQLQIVPANVNLLGDIKLRSFGIEERVSLQQKHNTLVVQCAAGSKPAGVLLKVPDTRLADFMSVNLSLSYRADSGIKLGIADQARFNKGDPIILGQLKPTMKLTGQRFSVPQNVRRDSQLHLSIICPEQPVSLLIEDLRFVTEQKVQITQKRGMWFWRPDLWQKKSIAVLNQAKRYQAGRVFISVELDEKNKTIMQQQALVDFIDQAEQQNIAVWVVEGDPRVVLPADRLRFVNRSRIYAAFNAKQAEQLRLAGIQYDIEPYLVPGYALQTETWVQAYVDTIKQLHSAVNMPLEVVIPFWWDKQMLDKKPLLDHLAPYVESVNVMNYRTSHNLLERFAQPVLNWGERQNRRVSIALEVGPLIAEQQLRFEKAVQGELWQVHVDAHHVLIYLDNAMENSKANVFKRVAIRDLDINELTFKEKQADLLRILPDLERNWSHWPSFSGISLHGLDAL